MKTYTAKAAEIERRWFIVDAEGRTLGRLATQVAHVLKGKHKPTYTAHMDTGDHVVVINASKVHLSGSKIDTRRFFGHTMYPGGGYWTELSELMEKHPERVIVQAVRGMLPKTKLGRAMIKKLKVYVGAEHPHAAQQPVEWNPAYATPRSA
jgi:large subunit ribosomal protein L13